jgi:Mn-containing catalase
LWKTLGIFAFLLTLCFAKGVSAQQSIRVNCGGPTYTDSKGQAWAADYAYNEGTASTINREYLRH